MRGRKRFKKGMGLTFLGIVAGSAITAVLVYVPFLLLGLFEFNFEITGGLGLLLGLLIVASLFIPGSVVAALFRDSAGRGAVSGAVTGFVGALIGRVLIEIASPFKEVVLPLTAVMIALAIFGAIVGAIGGWVGVAIGGRIAAKRERRRGR